MSIEIEKAFAIEQCGILRGVADRIIYRVADLDRGNTLAISDTILKLGEQAVERAHRLVRTLESLTTDVMNNRLAGELRDQFLDRFGTQATYDVDRELYGRSAGEQIHAWRELLS